MHKLLAFMFGGFPLFRNCQQYILQNQGMISGRFLTFLNCNLWCFEVYLKIIIENFTNRNKMQVFVFFFMLLLFNNKIKWYHRTQFIFIIISYHVICATQLIHLDLNKKNVKLKAWIRTSNAISKSANHFTFSKISLKIAQLSITNKICNHTSTCYSCHPDAHVCHVCG